MKLKIYSDGACRGNPGPSAIAFLILDHEDKLLKEHSEYVGIGTNNQAEYKALILALKSAIDYGDEAVCYLDSMLLVKQMNREWRVKHSNMIPLWREAIAAKERLSNISFVHTPRTNKYMERIDQLANQELDRVSNTIHTRKLTRGSIYSGMKDSEKKVASYLRKLDLWWVYEFPVFVYDEKKRPRVWTPDFYIPKLGMYIEVCGSKDFDYDYREKIYKKNGYHVIFVHLYKEPKKWKEYLMKRIKEIEDFRHSEVTKMIEQVGS